MGKKILFSIMTIAVVALLIGGGTYAYFSDTETASDNTFEAGTLNLKVGAADPCTESITVSNLKPGTNTTAANWAIENTGSIAGNLSINVSTITTNENTRYEMETDAGDTTDDDGELEEYLYVAIWMDISNDGWSSGDYYIEDNETAIAHTSGSSLPAEAYNKLIDYESDSLTDVQTNLPAGTIGTFKVEYDLRDDANINQVQSDNCTFDITFTLEQYQ